MDTKDQAIVCQDVKNQCTYVVKGLEHELDKAAMAFITHMQILNSHYYYRKLIKANVK